MNLYNQVKFTTSIDEEVANKSILLIIFDFLFEKIFIKEKRLANNTNNN